MKFLFFMRHPGYSRNFESVLVELAERGHEVHVVLDSTRASWLDGFNPLDPLHARFPKLTYGTVPGSKRRGVTLVARGLRTSIDYLRYLGPEYRNAPKLRERAAEKVPPFLRSFPGIRLRPIRALVAAVLRALERAVPLDPAIEAFLQEQQPDAVLVTPLVAMGSTQVDYVRAARRLGIPTALCTTSWDNLTNKGLMHEVPDLVAVWNDAQRQEAVALHHVPADRIAVTGAQCYDHWFAFRPSVSREEFCERVGLRADRPFVLYLCSSTFIAPQEVPFVSRWLETLRRAGGDLAETGVLVRPHPQNFAQWHDVELGEQTAVWPRGGADPIPMQAKQDYFDSMYHCNAVVGINTTAQIESAIIGRPVLTVLADEFRDTQGGTLHFAHISGDSGMLRVGSTLDEHVGHLRAALAQPGPDERTTAFVQSFIRPNGLERPATPILADAIETLATSKAAPLRRGVAAPLLAVFLRRPARRMERTAANAKEEQRSQKEPRVKPPKAAKPAGAKKTKAPKPAKREHRADRV